MKLWAIILFWAFFLVLSDVLINEIISLVVYPKKFNSDHLKYFSQKNLFYLFFLTCLLGPVYETFLYQFIIISVITSISAHRIIPFAAILISAAVFAIAHNHDIIHMISYFNAGLVLGGLYWFTRHNRFNVHPFFIVMCVHASHNFVVFIIQETARR